MSSTGEIKKMERFILAFTKYISFLFIILFIGGTVYCLMRVAFIRLDTMSGIRITVDYASLKQADKGDTDLVATGIEALVERKEIERQYQDDIVKIIKLGELTPPEASFDFIAKSAIQYPGKTRDDYITGMVSLMETAVLQKEEENFGMLLDKYNRVFRAAYEGIKSQNSEKLAIEKLYLSAAGVSFISLLLFVVILILLRIEFNTRNIEVNIRQNNEIA